MEPGEIVDDVEDVAAELDPPGLVVHRVFPGRDEGGLERIGDVHQLRGAVVEVPHPEPRPSQSTLWQYPDVPNEAARLSGPDRRCR